jgi:hypothetical protein
MICASHLLGGRRRNVLWFCAFYMGDLPRALAPPRASGSAALRFVRSNPTVERNPARRAAQRDDFDATAIAVNLQ